PEYLTDVAITQAHRAQLLQRAGRFPEAEADFKKAIGIQAQQAAAMPDKPEYRWRTASYRFKLANLLEEAGKPDPAQETYLQARQAQQQLADADPRNAGYLHDLVMTTRSLAFLAEDTDPDAARDWYQKALKLARGAARRNSRRWAETLR